VVRRVDVKAPSARRRPRTESRKPCVSVTTPSVISQTPIDTPPTVSRSVDATFGEPATTSDELSSSAVKNSIMTFELSTRSSLVIRHVRRWPA
jgi:hypothetical protein